MGKGNHAGIVRASFAAALLAVILTGACAPAMPPSEEVPEDAIPPEQLCRQDADCVPAQCCHARDAVNRAYAPDCSGTLCTQVCEPATLDCAQGEIHCIGKRCVAVIP